MNNTQLRELLVAFLEERAFNGRTGLDTGTLAERLANAQRKLIANCGKFLIPTIDRLCKRLVALKGSGPSTQQTQKQIRSLEQEIENADTRLRFEQKDGGASLVLGVVYFYFRLGQDSVAVGKQLETKPPHIRQIVWRLRNTWAKLERWRLDPSTRPVPKTPKPKRIPRPKHPPIDVERGAVLLAQGHTLPDASRLLGVSSCALRRALIKAGLYTLRFQKAKVVGLTEVINRQQTAKERHVAIAAKLATEMAAKFRAVAGCAPTATVLLTFSSVSILIGLRTYPANAPRPGRVGITTHSTRRGQSGCTRWECLWRRLIWHLVIRRNMGTIECVVRLSRQVFTTQKKNRASAARLCGVVTRLQQ